MVSLAAAFRTQTQKFQEYIFLLSFSIIPKFKYAEEFIVPGRYSEKHFERYFKPFYTVDIFLCNKRRTIFFFFCALRMKTQNRPPKIEKRNIFAYFLFPGHVQSSKFCSKLAPRCRRRSEKVRTLVERLLVTAEDTKTILLQQQIIWKTI